MKIWTFIKEHPYKTAATIIITGLIIYSVACRPTVTSVIDPPRRVNKFELAAEMDVIIVQFEDRFESIAQREEFATAIFNAAAQMYTTGTIDPIGVGMTLFALLGLGASADDVRLRRRIKRNGGTS